MLLLLFHVSVVLLTIPSRPQITLPLHRDLRQLGRLRDSADDPAFQKEWAAVKRIAKGKAAAFIEKRCGVTVSPDAMFDVQARL